MLNGEQRACAWCGRIFYAPLGEINRGNGRFCSRKCSACYGAAGRRAASSTARSTLYERAHRLANETGLLSEDSKCEQCGRLVGLGGDVHHHDRDALNNTRGNLSILCRSCHVRLHNMERRTPSQDFICQNCGRRFTVPGSKLKSGDCRGIYCCRSCVGRRSRPGESLSPVPAPAD